MGFSKFGLIFVKLCFCFFFFFCFNCCAGAPEQHYHYIEVTLMFVMLWFFSFCGLVFRGKLHSPSSP